MDRSRVVPIVLAILAVAAVSLVGIALYVIVTS
jgi:hypothetical protein